MEDNNCASFAGTGLLREQWWVHSKHDGSSAMGVSSRSLWPLKVRRPAHVLNRLRRKTQPYLHLNLGVLVSGTVTKYMFVL
jgi:hypothetical protein